MPPESAGMLARMKLAALARIALIGALALALLVPVLMIQGLVAERQLRRDEAVAGIAEGWGRRQTLSGPYLAVPYQVTRVEVTRETIDGKEREKRVERIEHLVKRIPAESLEWTVDADVSEKARGIYKARLYGAKAQVSGRFYLPPALELRTTSAPASSRRAWCSASPTRAASVR